MALVLVVDDSADQSLLVTALLEEAGHAVTAVASGEEALAAIERHAPDLLLTDLIMPGMDGLELVETVRTRNPQVPIVLMTAYGGGEVALQALKRGASSYVPKRKLAEDLLATVEGVLLLAREEREQARVLDFLRLSSYRFVLDNDENVIPAVVTFLRQRLETAFLGRDENTLMQIGIALQEALRNAMHHGNLEVDSSLRRQSSRAYDEKVVERLKDPRYSRRRVHLEVDIEHQEMRCLVRDEGVGFDPALVPDPTDAENVLRSSGRGLYLISTFMDSVEHNEAGNEIRMSKLLRR